MHDIEKRYYTGESIPASDFRNEEGGLEVFGKVVFPDWRNGEVVSQFSLDGDLYHRKLHPIQFTTPEEEHLARECELKNGVTKTI